jgi:hypothetical protein
LLKAPNIRVLFFVSYKYKMTEDNIPASDERIIDSGAIKAQAPGKTGPKPKELVESSYMGLPVGRDKKVIDPEDVRKLGAIGLNDRDIADFLGIKEDTLRYNFAEILLFSRAELKMTLRRAMLDNACKNMNASVQIFLSKNLLGMSDSPIDSETNKPLPWDDNE